MLSIISTSSESFRHYLAENSSLSFGTCNWPMRTGLMCVSLLAAVVIMVVAPPVVLAVAVGVPLPPRLPPPPQQQHK
ncbi:unnamed protein product [Didymodactylos carnosus]|nr:unnamed protein product [Didymodactylos carnosus]CAF3605402.1 unnamed protein product [Didymodactylos carnosus]